MHTPTVFQDDPKHTPISWNTSEVIARGGSRGWLVFDPSGDRICLTDETTAKFIVKACNSHADLLEALEELVDIVDGAREEGYDNIDYFTTQPARTAIAKAKE